MKKRLVLLLMTFAMVISGCQIKEKKSEIVVPSTTEHSVEEKIENPSKENVQKDEKNKEDVGTVEEVVDVKNEEASDNGKENVYKEQMELVYQALSEEWSIDKYFENEISSLIDSSPILELFILSEILSIKSSNTQISFSYLANL